MTPVSGSDPSPRWTNCFTGTPGIAFAALWGFAEATLFFILPDVPLSLAALYRPRRALAHVASILFGSFLGGALMFAWSAHSPAARHAVSDVPFVRPSMFLQAERDYQKLGTWSVAVGPVRGIPYKIYAVEATQHSSLLLFLLITIPARAWRLFAVWIIFSIAGTILRKLRLASLTPYLHACVWIAVYAIYWTRVSRS